MQCKDISDDEFLEAVDTARHLRGPNPYTDKIPYSTTIWDIQSVLSGYPEDVGTNSWSRDNSGYLPFNLIRAKARKLVKKGKLDGCVCGCRGDFSVITEEQQAENLLRRENRKKEVALLEWEAISREWRIRDEKIQAIDKELLAYRKATKALEKERGHLSIYTIVTKRGTSDII